MGGASLVYDALPALALLRLELRAVPSEELAELLAAGFRFRQHSRFVAEMRDQRFQGGEIVTPKRIADLARAKAVDAQGLEHAAAGTQRGFEGLALDDVDATRLELDVVRHVPRAGNDGELWKVLANAIGQ